MVSRFLSVYLRPLTNSRMHDVSKKQDQYEERPMIIANRPSKDGTRAPRTYSASITPLLQTVLATLADIDLAFECDLETIENSNADEALKAQAIEKLRERHRERRAPYARQLAKLERQIKALAA